ncbi:MAG: hypothetical protein AAF990_12620 [Bacteroidota bacterium]
MKIEGLKSYFSTIDPRLFNHVSGKPRQFIDTFRSQLFLTEEAFKKRLCGDKFDEGYYRDLKSRTLRILQALVIISPSKGASIVKKKFEICQKKFLIGQKFLTQDDREEGLRLVKQAFLDAENYGFTHLACEIASILHHDAVYYSKSSRSTKLYAQKSRQYLKDYTAEKEAEIQFHEIVEQLHKSTIAPHKLKRAIEDIEYYNGHSIKYKVHLAFLKVLYGLHTGSHSHIIDTCTKILLFFKNKKGVYPAHYFFFLQNRGVAQIAIKAHQEAYASFEEAEQYTTNRAYNLYTLQYYITLNALHAGDYLLAYTLYKKNKRCKIEHIRQHFALIEAYLCFLSHAGYLTLNRPFRMSKYLNDTFKVQQDKKGNNINILIAELLVYLVRNRAKFIDRIEAVQHYSYRYLRTKETERAKWFIKILCLLPKVDFHPIALQRKAKRYIDLMKRHPARMGEQLAVEIISFDVLLEMLIDQLKKKVA